eukprot:10018_1
MAAGSNQLIFSCCLFLLLSIVLIKCDISQRDRDVLIDLYSSTNGDGWHSNDSIWNISILKTGIICPSGLNGIECDETNTWVISIDLDSNGLYGTLPQSIGNLTQLQYLSFWGNGLSGTIPDSIGQLTQLQYLDLDSNAN